MVRTLLLLSLLAALPLMTAKAVQTPTDSSRTLTPYLVALNVKDASRTAQWYAKNLGFETTRTMDFPQYDSLKIIFLKRDACELELIQKKTSFDIRRYVPDYDSEKAPLQGVAKVGFMVRGVRQMADSLRQHGVKILYGPFDDEPFGIRTVIIEDLDGNLLQFSEPLESAMPGK